MRTEQRTVLLLATLLDPGEVAAVTDLLAQLRRSTVATLAVDRVPDAAVGPVRQLMRIGPLSIDPAARIAEISGARLDLRRMEFDLLAHLATDPRKVFSKRDLLRQVWGYRAEGVTRTVDTHASRLRRKLGVDHGMRWVINVRGVGYRLI